MKLRTPITDLIVGTLGAFSAFTNLRLGSLQLEDFLLLLLLGFCLAKFVSSGFSFRIAPNFKGLFMSCFLLLLCLFFLSLLAIRLKFFPLDDVSFLKQPVIFSLSKLLQFSAVFCGFLWLVNALAARKSRLGSALNIYWRIGIISSWYAILCYCVLVVVHFAAPSIFGAYGTEEGSLRARGFFNEGGPFGIYLVSVYVIGLIRRRVTGRRIGILNTAILSAAFFLSASKAGILAAAILMLFAIMSAASFRKRVYYLTIAIVLLGGAAIWLDLGNQLLGYWYSYQNFDEELAARGNDYNLVVGRVSALHIVPKMILAHPITGIGFGNYPLMRNDPDYLDGLPTITEIEDLPALGIPAIAAEMGIPVTIWLMSLLFTPYWISRKRGHVIAIGGIYLPLASILAVQLTFFYPWFVAACAYAASCLESQDCLFKPDTPPFLGSGDMSSVTALATTTPMQF